MGRRGVRSLQVPPPPPPRVFGANPLFSTHWRQSPTVKYTVFKNLEGKFLKAENLSRLMCDTRTGREGAKMGRGWGTVQSS